MLTLLYSEADPERGGQGAMAPPHTLRIIMLHNLFKEGKCIRSKHKGPFFGSLLLQ